MATDLHAELLLAYDVLPLARLIREGDIASAWAMLRNSRADRVREICMLLAAMVDPDLPRQRLLGWYEGGRPDGPEHADEWTEAPPLRVGAK